MMDKRWWRGDGGEEMVERRWWRGDGGEEMVDKRWNRLERGREGELLLLIILFVLLWIEMKL